jgi:hypothetical protein
MDLIGIGESLIRLLQGRKRRWSHIAPTLGGTYYPGTPFGPSAHILLRRGNWSIVVDEVRQRSGSRTFQFTRAYVPCRCVKPFEFRIARSGILDDLFTLSEGRVFTGVDSSLLATGFPDRMIKAITKGPAGAFVDAEPDASVFSSDGSWGFVEMDHADCYVACMVGGLAYSQEHFELLLAVSVSLTKTLLELGFIEPPTNSCPGGAAGQSELGA